MWRSRPTKGGHAAGARAIEARAVRPGSLQIEHPHRLDHTLDLEAPETQSSLAGQAPDVVGALAAGG